MPSSLIHYDRRMVDRPWENVWAQIVSEAWAHRLSGEPITTLDQEISNVILGVNPSTIRRRSSLPHAGGSGETNVPASAVQRLWQQLLERGETYEAVTPVFTYALIARFISGIDHATDPLRLIVSDRTAAMTPWSGSALMHVLLKWSPARERATIERHREIADRRGSVWWGYIGGAPPSAQRAQALRLELDGGADVFAYLYETGSDASAARTAH